MNLWQAIKWQGRFDEIESEVTSADLSAHKTKFRLAQLVLLERYEDVRVQLPLAISAKHLTASDVKEWPLFRALRKTVEYETWLASGT